MKICRTNVFLLFYKTKCAGQKNRAHLRGVVSPSALNLSRPVKLVNNIPYNNIQDPKKVTFSYMFGKREQCGNQKEKLGQSTYFLNPRFFSFQYILR